MKNNPYHKETVWPTTIRIRKHWRRRDNIARIGCVIRSMYRMRVNPFDFKAIKALWWTWGPIDE